MGLGKTLQVIAAVKKLLGQGIIYRVLVVAPSSLLETWRSEFERWAPEITVRLARGGEAREGV